MYPTLTDGDQDRTPAISMSWLFTVNAPTTYPFSFQIRAKYEFRGRVLTDEPGLVEYLRVTREAKGKSVNKALQTHTGVQVTKGMV